MRVRYVLGKALPPLLILLATFSVTSVLIFGPGAPISALAEILLLIATGLLMWQRLRQTAREARRVTRTIERLTRGELALRLAERPLSEFSRVAEALNRLAQAFNERMREVLEQRNELGTVLESMSEGVLAISSDARIIRANRAAKELFGVLEDFKGKLLHETVRLSALHKFVSDALIGTAAKDHEIQLERQGQQLQLRCNATPLIDPDGQASGILIVLTDVTEFRRLEQMRKEFVANVSHELKTPITSIKGSVETLLDGAGESVADRERFLRIIERQTSRLGTIIDDLLKLSQIERDRVREFVRMEELELKPILDAAIQLCAPAAEKKRITITSSVADGACARVAAPLLEQGITNLLDNAIKYSDENSTVRLEVRISEAEVVIVVTDRGRGIPREHQGRIFERFYRLDSARSRSVGGTGLGLAIVKHIAQLHHGQARVVSAPGEGSSFSIHLPRQKCSGAAHEPLIAEAH